MPLIKEILILSLIYYWFIAMASAEVTQLNIKPCKRGREFHGKKNSKQNERWKGSVYCNISSY